MMSSEFGSEFGDDSCGEISSTAGNSDTSSSSNSVQ